LSDSVSVKKDARVAVRRAFRLASAKWPWGAANHVGRSDSGCCSVVASIFAGLELEEGAEGVKKEFGRDAAGSASKVSSTKWLRK
jgi:hypothetical protein